ncbi:hypothetical protein ABT150_23640 [Streptomyces mirabilis]|uniref:hypothetical protein n=1 Tax=Streptomyces mirabilis TaxID=68239 RepID=UPI0033262A1B
MAEAKTIRLRITQDGNPFFEGDVEVHPWHTAPFGDDPWEAWLHRVGPEWVDRTAGNIREELFRAVAMDAASGIQLASIGFVHSTPKTVTVTVENEAAATLREGLDSLFRRLGPPATGK